MWGAIKKTINSKLDIPVNKQLGSKYVGSKRYAPVLNTNVPSIGQVPELDDEVYSLEITSDGYYLYVATSSHTVKKVDLSSLTVGTALITHTYYVTSLAISPDGAYVFSGSRDDTVKQLITSTDSAGWTFTGHTDGIYSLMVSPDSLYVYSVSWDDSSVRQSVISDGSAGWVHTGSGRVSGGVVSNDGNYLYVYSQIEDGIVQLDTSDGSKVKTVCTTEVDPYSISSDDSFLYGGGYQILQKIDISTGTIEWGNTDFTDMVMSTIISNCGNYVYAGGYDRALYQVSSLDGNTIWSTENVDYIYDLAMSPDNKKVYTNSESPDKTRYGVREYINLFHEIKYYKEMI